MHGPNLILFFVQIAHADSQLQHAMVGPTAEAAKRPQNAPLRNRQNFFLPPSCTQNDSFPSPLSFWEFNRAGALFGPTAGYPLCIFHALSFFGKCPPPSLSHIFVIFPPLFMLFSFPLPSFPSASCRADCSKVDSPNVEPEHNGLTQFGRVSIAKICL